MCKIPLNSPVQAVESDIDFSDDETEVGWSELDSTMSSTITTTDTSMSSNTASNSTMTQSYSSTPTANSFDEDFCGFTDDDLAFVGTEDEIEEYYLTDYLEVSDEYTENWDNVDYLDEDEESDMVDGNSHEANWSKVFFEDEEFCQCYKSNSLQAPNPTTYILQDTDLDYETDSEEAEAERNIPLDDKSPKTDSSAMLQLYHKEIAECAKEVLGTSTSQLNAEYNFDVPKIPLPGEDNCWLVNGHQCACQDWLPFEFEQNTVPVLSSDFVISEPYTCSDIFYLDKAMSPRVYAELTNFSEAQQK